MATSARLRSGWLKLVFGALGLSLMAVAASAGAEDRDPLYEEARREGLVGERPDGYLGFVVPPSPELCIPASR
jgi:uncharacterized protein YdbL (DUF1318 family)